MIKRAKVKTQKHKIEGGISFGEKESNAVLPYQSAGGISGVVVAVVFPLGPQQYFHSKNLTIREIPM